MSTLLKIDEEAISADQFIKFLKFSNEFSELMKKLIRNKVTVHAAKKRGITVSTEEVQQMADDFRRCIGLHRAKETHEWIERIGITPEDFETFITEHVFKKKMIDTLTTEEAVAAYFNLNAPRFDTADIKHIVVEGREKAMEFIALLDEEPENFDEFAREYSLDDETKNTGGYIPEVRRGILPDEVEAKVFNASADDILGPFQVGEEELYEIIRVTAIHPARLDKSAREKISEAIYDEWLNERLKEHSVRF
ncbi:peptidylprolyl isomerase [Desulfonema magnum]|uniref:peptidylprolyl isomerase n=1 Tax=Desulfonema magnum TaxID=45655 RepID=A0A975BRL4_9BACT|nr:peptidylprolyl isomerase [Desulfonema magnum]QTA89934.1 Peptidylprolyl isomerase [Desulfonema magnum]